MNLILQVRQVYEIQLDLRDSTHVEAESSSRDLYVSYDLVCTKSFFFALKQKKTLSMHQCTRLQLQHYRKLTRPLILEQASLSSTPTT